MYVHFTRHNLSVTRSSSEHSSARTSHSQSGKRPRSYQLQRNATQHSKTQQAYNFTITREHVRPIHTIRHMPLYNQVQKTDTEHSYTRNSHNMLVATSYKAAIQNTPLHVSYNRLELISYRTAILSTLIHVNDTHKPQQVKCLSDKEDINLAHFKM
jgi:flagellar basal body rod protein FlgG